MLRTKSLANLKRCIPKPVAVASRPLRRLMNFAWNWAKYGFPPPPEGTEMVGYEALINFLNANRILDLPGDLVEIGAFCGGGTYKLGKFLSRKAARKKVYVIDCFDIGRDMTECTAGTQMTQLYSRQLDGRSQKEVFYEVTRGLSNIEVIEEDSKCARIPAETVCFAFVDGNHAPEYVRNDFYLVWGKLAPGGVVAFHDYGYDLPPVTAVLDKLCAQHQEEISNRSVNEEKHILFIQKRRPLEQ